MNELHKQENWKLGFVAYLHTSGAFFITRRAVRAIITHTVIVTNKLWCGWQPVVVSAIVTYKPYLHVPTSITQIFDTVKLESSHA